MTDGLRACARCGNDTTGTLCWSCLQQKMIDGYGDEDEFGWDDEDEEPYPCPRCAGQDTLHQTTTSARCWHEDTDSGDEGIFITVEGWYCYDCEHVWEVQHGRPLNVDCECD